MNVENVSNRNLSQMIESNHLQSLKSLCELLMREVTVLSRVTPEHEFPEISLSSERQISLSDEVERFEVNLIRSALLQSKGRQTQAAKMLGIKISTLNTKIKRYGIDFLEFK